jgi:hypothetical protein
VAFRLQKWNESQTKVKIDNFKNQNQNQNQIVAAKSKTNQTTQTLVSGPLLNYILREEGGLGGTIDRLSGLHDLFFPHVGAASPHFLKYFLIE